MNDKNIVVKKNSLVSISSGGAHHLQRKKERVSQYCQEWKENKGLSCPYATKPFKRKSFRRSTSTTKKPSWNGTIVPVTGMSIDYNIVTALKTPSVGKPPQLIVSKGAPSQLSLPRLQNVATINSPPLPYNKITKPKNYHSKLIIQPQIATGLKNPCRSCRHLIRPFIRILYEDSEVFQSKPSSDFGKCPVWAPDDGNTAHIDIIDKTKGAVKILVLIKCGIKEKELGRAVLHPGDDNIASEESCIYLQLSKKKRGACGKLKVVLSLENVVPAKAPRPILLFGGGGAGGGPSSPLAAALLQGKQNLKKSTPTKPPEETLLPTTNTSSRQKSLLYLERLSASVILASMEIKHDDLVIKRQVGEGLHAVVTQAHFLSRNSVVVAVKEFQYVKSPPPVAVLENFENEYTILSKLKSENVLSLLGVVLSPKLCLVTPYMEFGSLYQFLMNEKSPRSVELKTQLALDVASGVASIHSAGYMHRDIKSHNIFITEKNGRPSAIIGDLGSAIVFRPKCFEPTGTSGYTAPEVFDTTVGYDEKADVWSIAILLWELFTTAGIQNPFLGLCPEDFCQKAFKGTRPELSLDFPKEIGELITACWATAPEDRPSMKIVVNTLLSSH